MNNAIRFNSEANYQADLKVLQDKFAQTIGVGVRQIAILADDAANVGGNNYTKLLTDMVAWLKEMKKTYLTSRPRCRSSRRNTWATA